GHAADHKHFGKELLSESELVTIDAIVRLQQPSRAALEKRMAGVARNGLHHLREKRSRVSVELAPKHRQTRLQFLKILKRDADAVTGHLDDGAMHGLIIAHDRADVDHTLPSRG